MRKHIIGLTILLFTLMLVSCNVDSGETNFEVTTITHYVTTDGVVNVEKEEEVIVSPEVVAVFDLSIIDIFDYIGLEKFEITKLSLVKGSLPSYLSHYNIDTYQNSGTLFDIDFEVLDILLPDLIIIGGRSSAHYDALKTRYPNSSVLDTSNTTFSLARFEGVINNLGQIFPNAKISLDEALEDTLSRIPSIIELTESYSASILMVTGDEYSVYGKGSRLTTIFDDFKFIVSDPNLQTENTHGHVIDSEYFDNISPDIIFFVDRGFATGQTDPAVDRAMENPYIVQTPAGQNDYLFQLDAASWYILPGGFTSTNQMIDDINDFVQIISS